MNTVLGEQTWTTSAKHFIGSRRNLLIGGEWVPAASGKTFAVFDPAYGREIARVAEADVEDVNRAVEAARKAFEGGPWSRMTASERGRMLWKLAELIETHTDELAEIESIDNGKPFSVARVADLPLSVDLLRYHAGWATKVRGTTMEIPGSYLAYTLREPIGVVAAIIPWNFPLLMAVWKLAPALAVGCTVVLKLAEQTPLSGLRLGELIQEAGFPPGTVNILAGFGETAGAALAAHNGVDKIAFTGSTEVGKLIVRAAAGNLKKVTLELGGKSPTVVFADADLNAAIPGVSTSIFFNHGQCCVAGSRLYAHEKVFDQVVEGVASAARNIKLGPGLNTDSEMGPLVSQEQYKRVSDYIQSGSNEGARVVVGGQGSVREKGYFIRPTVLTNVSSDMKVVREEIFGPVLVATPFSDNDIEAIAREANDTIYGLAANVWTSDIAVAHLMAKRIRAGTVWVNCTTVLDPALPFGGYKQSGWGRENSEFVIDEYTELKTIVAALKTKQ
jgi:phenylacetaldehyde dehydrogenase